MFVPSDLCTVQRLYSPNFVPSNVLQSDLFTVQLLYCATFVSSNVCTVRPLYRPTIELSNLCTVQRLYSPTFVPSNVCTVRPLYPQTFYSPTFVPSNVCTSAWKVLSILIQTGLSITNKWLSTLTESWPGLLTSNGQAYSRVMHDNIWTFYSMQVNVMNKIINMF